MDDECRSAIIKLTSFCHLLTAVLIFWGESYSPKQQGELWLCTQVVRKCSACWHTLEYDSGMPRGQLSICVGHTLLKKSFQISYPLHIYNKFTWKSDICGHPLAISYSGLYAAGPCVPQSYPGWFAFVWILANDHDGMTQQPRCECHSSDVWFQSKVPDRKSRKNTIITIYFFYLHTVVEVKFKSGLQMALKMLYVNSQKIVLQYLPSCSTTRNGWQCPLTRSVECHSLLLELPGDYENLSTDVLEQQFLFTTKTYLCNLFHKVLGPVPHVKAVPYTVAFELSFFWV